jgi:hypothetical protein
LKRLAWPSSGHAFPFVIGVGLPLRIIAIGAWPVRMPRGPAPEQQFAETSVGPVIDEPDQHVSQVGIWIDAMHFARLDQQGEYRPIFCPFI